MAANSNPLVPPMDPRQMAALGIQNPFAPPEPPPPSPSMGFQVWASDPRNAHKVVPAMTPPEQPLQPNAGQPSAAATPPKPQPMAAAQPPQIPGMQQAQGQLGSDQAELQRLQQSGAAVHHVKNPVLRVLGEIGNVAAPFLLGTGAMAIPGTTAHNLWLQQQAQGRVGNDQQDITDTLSNAKTQQDIQNAPIELGIKQQAASLKGLQAQGTFAQHGLKAVQNEDGTTSIVPDEDSPVYQQQQQKEQTLQAQAEYMRAGIELRSAQTALANAKNDPNSPSYKQAQQRLAVAQQNASSAAERARSYMGRYMQSAYGVGMDGQPLAGSMLTEDGQVVGTGNAQNVRPTGTQRAKGNMAESADQQIEDMKSIVAKRPDIFGPAAGRKTNFNVWLGSQDPDAQRFRAARTIAGDHLAGTFGGRSEAALSALDSAIGNFKDNPTAVNAGLDQLKEANHLFLKAGKVNTVGGKGNPMQPPAKTAYKMTATGANGQKIGSNDGGKTWVDVKTRKQVQ